MKKSRKLFARLYPSYLLITLLPVLILVWYFIDVLRAESLHQTISHLKSHAFLVGQTIEERLTPEDSPWIDSLCKQLGKQLASRLTVVLISGVVVGDSIEDPQNLEDFSDRREVKTALSGKLGVVERFSPKKNAVVVHVALPILRDGNVLGVVRASMPMLETSTPQLAGFWREIGLRALFVVLAATLVAMYVSYRLNRPLRAMKEGALKFAQGQLNYRIRIPRTEEMSELAEAMNIMASDLRERIETVTRQRNELEAVLSSMVEAVLVIDADERLIRVNRAAEVLFGLKSHQLQGPSVLEVIRNTDLVRFVRRTLDETGPVEGDIVIFGDPEKHLQAHGTKLDRTDGTVMGALVVLNDVTRLKSLERVRRDFVANVSHELKTPVTTIKGFLETLKEGALEDPESAHRFLDIIIKHTDRLAMIIEDLLILSRIEQETEKRGIRLETGSLRKVLDAVMRACEAKAAERNVSITIRCDEELVARINPTLLEQALSNMVDNAIKYSGPGTAVTVQAEKTDDEVLVKVIDQGCGIPREHLGRIFERFYRVDKGRSRDSGGTGLGLAIAKHIVNAHHGKIELRSSPGAGSTFTVRLPLA